MPLPYDIRKEMAAQRAAHDRRNAAASEGEKAGTGPPQDKSLPGPAENKGDTRAVPHLQAGHALTGMDFASDAAAEAAVRAGLTAADFRGKEPSGARGFTVADVREIAGG